MEKKNEEIKPYTTGAKKNSTFMINPELERDAKDFAVLKRMSYSALVEQCILEKILPYRESLKEFFSKELKPSHRDKPFLPDVSPEMQKIYKKARSGKSSKKK